MAVVRKSRKSKTMEDDQEFFQVNADRQEAFNEAPSYNEEAGNDPASDGTERSGAKKIVVRAKGHQNHPLKAGPVSSPAANGGTPSVNQQEPPAAPVPSPSFPVPSFPRLPSMPDIYGRPEPRLDQDNGKPRLIINELIRLNMIDLRELAAVYNISHDDMVSMKKQEIIFSLLKAHTERGGIIYAYGSLEILPDGYG
ncbi:MAG: Rho termination factor N-terminal domain-containing protein, partial [Treponema sp.]|nr:Rho termination factor N-terminal domain-containing protein [Treponema sp.]